jgi:type IX secretion system PorP/SprF family membrane protein
MKKTIQTIFLRLFWTTCLMHRLAYAQVDPHFSQYYNQPMAINPALTGAIEGDYRVSAIFRSQYGNTLTTKGVSGEVVSNKNTNFGFNLLNQSTSDKSYNFTNAYLSMAYTGVRFGPNADHYLVLAMQCGFLNRRFDVSKLQFGDQYASGIGYDPNAASGEVFSNTSVLSFDAGVGVAYYDAVPDKKVSWFGGFSAYHLTSPQNPFLSGGTGESLPVRYTVHGGARINTSDYFNIVPSFIYMREGSASEKMVGAYLQLYASDATDMIFGANYRMGDAIIPFAGFYYKGLTMGASYDVTVSSVNAAAARTNTLEFSLSYIGIGKNKVKTKPFYCPRF